VAERRPKQKKPLSRFALVLWGLAVAFAIFDLTVLIVSPIYSRESGAAYLLIGGISTALEAAIWHSATLFGLGALVEMADRILWHIRKSN
jgi:hypothetical protein